MADRASIAPSRSDLARLRAQLDDKQFKAAIYQAVSRTARNMSVVLRKETAQELNAKSTAIAAAITSSVSKGSDPVGSIRVDRKPLPLIDFKPNVSKKNGVKATMLKARSEGVAFAHAFRVTTKTGHVGIYMREKGKGGNLTPKGISRRLPIQELAGVPVISTIESDEAQEKFLSEVGPAFKKNLLSQLDRFLKGR